MAGSVAALRQALEDIEVRYVAQIPPEDLNQSARLFLELEQAWWFYEDKLCVSMPNVPKLKEDEFYKSVFEYSPTLQHLRCQYRAMYDEYSNYRKVIPAHGCILLTDDLSKVVLVKSFYNKGWGFPRGKINEGETDVACALRETKEETGFDCSQLKFDYHRDRLRFKKEVTLSDGTVVEKPMDLFVLVGVPEKYGFHPLLPNEIEKIQLWDIGTVLENKDSRFGMVLPYSTQLRYWIGKKLLERKQKGMEMKLTSYQETLLHMAETKAKTPSKTKAVQQNAVDDAGNGSSKREPKSKTSSNKEASKTSHQIPEKKNTSIQTLGVFTVDCERLTRIMQRHLGS